MGVFIAKQYMSRRSSSTTPSYKIITSSAGESLVEAYHAVFSYLSSSLNIYTELAKLCGSGFYRRASPPDKNTSTIFCKNNAETHYKYYNAPTRRIYDPYESFQLYNSHGNCFAFALYLSSKMNGANMFPQELVDISPFIEQVGTGHKKYLRVKPSLEKEAYRAFVQNDYLIINMMLNIVSSTQHIYDMYEYEWDKMTQEERDDFGIDVRYSFKSYLKDFKKMAKNIDNVHHMTWDQIINWDEASQNILPHDNSGIPHAGTPGHLQEFDYKTRVSSKSRSRSWGETRRRTPRSNDT